MRHPGRWIAAAVAVVVVVLGVVLALNVGNDPTEPQASPLLDKAVPPFELSTLDGSTVSSESLAGKTVIVNFWNTWCAPCRAELPALKEFWDGHVADGDVEMVGIVRDDTTRRVREYVEDQGIDWTIALDPGSRAALDFATRGQPETFAISPSGRVVGYQLSEMNVAGLEAMLDVARRTG